MVFIFDKISLIYVKSLKTFENILTILSRLVVEFINEKPITIYYWLFRKVCLYTINIIFDVLKQSSQATQTDIGSSD